MQRLLPVLLLVACNPEPPAPLSPDGRVVIEELYYAGSPPSGGTDHYFSNQFIELANNSPDRVKVGGLYIGDLYGAAGAINPGMEPDSYGRAGRLVFENVWRIPGEPEDLVLEPGESLVIAHDGTNHRPFSTLNLSGADYESFVEESGGDDDHPTVANLEPVHFSGGYDWLMTVFGPSVVVLEADAEFEDFAAGPWPLVESDPGEVVDCIDALMDGGSGDFKRVPEDLDAGFVYVSDTYSGESVRRIRTGNTAEEGGWLADSDDSSVDFELSPEPEPAGP